MTVQAITIQAIYTAESAVGHSVPPDHCSPPAFLHWHSPVHFREEEEEEEEEKRRRGKRKKRKKGTRSWTTHSSGHTRSASAAHMTRELCCHGRSCAIRALWGGARFRCGAALCWDFFFQKRDQLALLPQTEGQKEEGGAGNDTFFFLSKMSKPQKQEMQNHKVRQNQTTCEWDLASCACLAGRWFAPELTFSFSKVGNSATNNGSSQCAGSQRDRSALHSRQSAAAALQKRTCPR